MGARQDVEKSLRLVSQAWGPQSGYCFFPYIDRSEQEASGTRNKGFHEGPFFEWPKEREEIVDYLLTHTNHDVYWTAVLYEEPMRLTEYAMNEYALWADLDEANPELIEGYRPSIAWESSPGHYQALWIAQRGADSFLGASWPGKENQRLTYAVGADPSGWDTVQLLRIPGWANHKPEYRDENGNSPRGKLLWFDGPRYHLSDFSDLPEVRGVGETLVNDALAADIDSVHREAVIARIKLKLNHTARELLSARKAGADRSERLWYLIRCLADVGLSVTEIVAVVKGTVWNKFEGRHNELQTLINEASKAIAMRSDEVNEKLETEAQEDGLIKVAPERLGSLLRNIPNPKYLIKDILTEGACGFIAGEPKSYKSWLGLDMAFSVATGADFLGHFRVVSPGPVLYIQEEDPLPTLKSRSAKIWATKGVDKIQLIESGEDAGLWWLPPEEEAKFDPDVMAYVQKSFTISDEAWIIWLDETVAAGMNGVPYKLLIIDTLMMTAGDVEENRSQEMTTKVFKPLKVISRKYNLAIQVIHHMAKSEKSRPGQRMLGAVANHAWAEDSIYLGQTGTAHIRMDTESKSIVGQAFRMSNLQNNEWLPIIEPWREEKADPTPAAQDARWEAREVKPRKRSTKKMATPASNDNLRLLDEQGPMTTTALAKARGVSRGTISTQMHRLAEEDVVTFESDSRGRTIWSLK